ncbi:hypothetical protein ACJMK2_012394 [Sinanodonta woodiana]|uniref:RAP domain-containing protein n=1 Tax=Sinanodonta woodiana TaxID=1069815 RepID=A0ABD3V837_SINWO
MLACRLAIHIGRELRCMHRLTQYWRVTSCNNIWTCRYVEATAPCFASSLNLRVLQGLHCSDFWKAATVSRRLASYDRFEKRPNTQDDVNAMFQTFAEKFSVNNFDPIEAVNWLRFLKTFMLDTVTGFQNQDQVITVDNVFHYRKLSEISMYVLQNSHFHSLLNQIQGHLLHFTAADNTELFVSLVALDISFEHSIMQELISLFHNKNYPMSLNDLALIVHGIQSSHFRNDLFFIQAFLPRMQKVYETNKFIKNTSCTLPRLAMLLPLFKFVQCSGMRDWYIERLLSMAEDDSCMNLDSVRNIFAMFINNSYRSLPFSCIARLAFLCFKETEKRLHELHNLQPYDIAVFAYACGHCDKKQLGLTTRALHILERIHFLALNMLKNVSTSTSLKEILLLLSGVKLEVLNEKKREQFGALVAEHLDKANAHELVRFTSLTPISEHVIKTYDSAFNAAVSRNMDTIMATPLLFSKMSNYYASLPVSLPMYRTLLFRMHKTQMMLEPKRFAYLAQMIMCTFSEDNSFPRLIVYKTESMISQFSLFDIAVILRGLDCLHRNWSTREIICDLHIQLEKAFVQKIETTELKQLCVATYKLCSFNNSKRSHAYKFNLLLDRIANLTQFMRTDEFHQIVQLICKKDLYHTVILEALTQYFIRHNETVMESSFVLLVQAIAKSGYELQEHSVFTKLCIEKTLNHFSKMDIKEQIFLAYYLSMLQICPEEILCQILSFDNLALLDKHRAQLGLNISIHIMYLNRCAVLEYPQLNIPWFHEDFGIVRNLYFDRIDRCFPSLFIALSQVLGGPKFFKKNVRTPYFNSISAEFFLDKNKRPVFYLEAKQVQAGNALYQPIAIVPAVERTIRSINEDEILTGIMQMNIRQLEILGYKVVVIYFSEWNSLAMCDQDERVNYLNERIFTV